MRCHLTSHPHMHVSNNKMVTRAGTVPSTSSGGGASHVICGRHNLEPAPYSMMGARLHMHGTHDGVSKGPPPLRAVDDSMQSSAAAAAAAAAAARDASTTAAAISSSTSRHSQTPRDSDAQTSTTTTTMPQVNLQNLAAGGAAAILAIYAFNAQQNGTPPTNITNELSAERAKIITSRLAPRPFVTNLQKYAMTHASARRAMSTTTNNSKKDVVYDKSRASARVGGGVAAGVLSSCVAFPLEVLAIGEQVKAAESEEEQEEDDEENASVSSSSSSSSNTPTLLQLPASASSFGWSMGSAVVGQSAYFATYELLAFLAGFDPRVTGNAARLIAHTTVASSMAWIANSPFELGKVRSVATATGREAGTDEIEPLDVALNVGAGMTLTVIEYVTFYLVAAAIVQSAFSDGGSNAASWLVSPGASASAGASALRPLASGTLGVVSAMLAVGITHPLHTIKALAMAEREEESGGEGRGVVQIVEDVVSTSGVAGLYAGLGYATARTLVPAFTFFALLPACERILATLSK